MALKKYRFPVTVGVPDPLQDRPEVRDPVTGSLIIPFCKGVKHVPPGEWVEVEEAEAEKIYKTWGSFEDYEARKVSAEADRLRHKTGTRSIG